ncbi:MAG: MmgE/PrpD family protein [Alphaproteobacteria bacterium]|nr:MmgE/PrpD family protein [Alphaproteobacteria bacterium]
MAEHPDYLNQLAEAVAATGFDDLPASVTDHAKTVIADCVAAIAGGAAEPEMTALTESMLDGATGPALVIGPNRSAEPAKAAFLNGTSGTFLEMDEGNQFARGHPGIHVVPAALAYAEDHGCSGPDFVAAIVWGYEVGSRIGIASKIRMSMHPHGTWGTVGAAVSLAKLARLDAGQIAEIISVSSSLGLATSRQTMLQGGTVRNSYAGVSNQMGFLALDLVKAGFTGEYDGLATIYGKVVSDNFVPEEMTKELGQRWEIARNYFKRHACCRYNHATLDALADIARERDIQPEQVERVHVDTYSLAAELSDQSPQNVLAGKFSLPFAVATTLVNKSSGVMSFTRDQVRNDRVQELAKRVDVTEDPSLTAMMPAYRPSVVRVELTDGTSAEAETKTNKGDAEDPYTADELKEKFFELTARVWSTASAEAVFEGISRLESLEDINELTAPLKSAA